jgi:hypothetical protein
MADIFLSYRRQDSSSATGRLADRLEQYFGRQRVFRDYDSIRAGTDFADTIRQAIDVATVVLAIVGPDWAEVRDARGQRRLDDPGDFVRLEIESALAADVTVIPVLVEGARMPGPEHLPPSLAAFCRCQAIELSESRWHDDVNRLIADLQSQFAIESEQAPLPATAGIGVLARLALDMLELASHPTRLIARRQTGHAVDHVRAFAFLLVCLMLGNLGLVVGLGLPAAVSWLLVGLLSGLILITLLSIPLTLAWRICGARTDFRQVTLIFAYVYGGAWLGFCAGTLLIVMGMQLVDAHVFERYLEILRTPASMDDRLAQARNLMNGMLKGPVYAMATLAAIVWLLAAAWTAVAWGAFRHRFNLGYLRALGATLLWLGLLGTVVLLVGWAGQTGGGLAVLAPATGSGG